MEFWTEPQMASIDKMLNPRSIADRGRNVADAVWREVCGWRGSS